MNVIINHEVLVLMFILNRSVLVINVYSKWYSPPVISVYSKWYSHLVFNVNIKWYSPLVLNVYSK